MSKNKPAKKSAARAQLGAIDPGMLFALLENHFTDIDTSPYRRLYAESRAALLQVDAPGAVAFADLLEAVDEFAGVETATRGAGFVVGFETCRQLLLGELDLAALKNEGGR
jgi:hypothetical protein